jgi:hypothetical protein
MKYGMTMLRATDLVCPYSTLFKKRKKNGELVRNWQILIFFVVALEKKNLAFK